MVTYTSRFAREVKNGGIEFSWLRDIVDMVPRIFGLGDTNHRYSVMRGGG